jgi:tRNA dimethylallyltransferase
MRCAMSEARLPPLVVLVGATAVGKTALSLALCERFAGEVVSADSRQIYRGMDIGTAKATPAERAQVPHHLIDIRDPDAVLTVAEYQALAYASIDDIHRRGRVPFLVGGTALYVRAVAAGLRIPSVPPDPALRAALEADLAAQGVAALARSGWPNSTRRVRRGSTCATRGGCCGRWRSYCSPASRKWIWRAASRRRTASCLLALDRPRAELHRRIDARVDEMFAAGLVAETQRLLAAGYAPTLPAMTSLGYREVIAYLAGELTLAAAAERVKLETHRFVRHQATSFRKLDGLRWFDLARQAETEVIAAVADWLEDTWPICSHWHGCSPQV